MRRVLALLVVIAAVAIPVGIIFVAARDQDDGKHVRPFVFDHTRRTEPEGSPARGVLDELGDFQARHRQTIRLGVDDLLDWSREEASDADALSELFVICDAIPRLGAFTLGATGPTATPVPRDAAVTDFCDDVRERVIGQTTTQWKVRIDDQIAGSEPITLAGGRRAVEAHADSLRHWAAAVQSERNLDTDYVVRFCRRGESTGFYAASSPPDAADDLLAPIVDICADVLANPDMTSAALADRIIKQVPDAR